MCPKLAPYPSSLERRSLCLSPPVPPARPVEPEIGLAAGMVFAPRPTRLVTTVLTAVAASDTMQLAYDAGKQLQQRAGD